MSRLFWALLFAAVPLGAVAVTVLSGQAPGLQTATLPSNLSVAGQTIDHIYWVIHDIAAVILLATGLFLSVTIARFGNRSGRGRYVHGNPALEIVWSVIPAGILIWLAFYQMNSWSDNKVERPQVQIADARVDQPPLARLIARQFGWEVQYPGADGRLDTPDDLYEQNRIVVPIGEEVVLELRSLDVIHSFFAPQLRVKQDIVPGSDFACWFCVLPETPPQTIDFVCAELCGWGHYKMNGIMQLVSRGEFDRQMVEMAQRRYAD